jgi:hypothetical protein
VAARCAEAALAGCLATALAAAGYTVMSRASAASQAGRRPGNAIFASRPQRGGHGSLVDLAQTQRPPGPPLACAARATATAALARLLRRHTGELAVAVADLTSGVTASYHGLQAFHTASIVKASILAALLLQLQRWHTAPGSGDQALAAAMIDNSDNAAASALWNAIGGGAGLAAADRALGLPHTVPGPGGFWGLTATTATDQVRLLAALTSPRSPLTAASRRYELGLMRSVTAGQAWGVTAAADPRTRPAVKNGWLPDGLAGLWDINSIGVISRHGHQLLIAVLSSGQPTQQAGISQVQAAATAAAHAVAAAHACPPR